MILGKIVGKTSTNGFQFLVEKPTKKFEYVQVPLSDKGIRYVLCQVLELEQDDKIIAKCIPLGYKDEMGRIVQPRTPFPPGTEVLKAEEKTIRDIFLQQSKGALVGMLDGKDIKVFLDLQKVLNKHIAVLAKSGAGKSYAVGVLVEEILEHNIPLLIIDPHGEYGQMRHTNDNEQDLSLFDRFGIRGKAFLKQIQEFGDIDLNPELTPLKLSDSFDVREISHILPGKLNANQLSCLYSAVKNLNKVDLDALIEELELQESNVKWTIIDNLTYLKKLGIFSSRPTYNSDIIKPGMCSILNLKGMEPEIAEIIVYKVLKDLFQARKKDNIPPFFAVVEEAHNFCPERSFGETKCSKILRTIASEGRKFGLGLCVVSQRPARVDKSVLSQCSTHIILKITNPSDLRAITSSVEGITAEAEQEIKNLPVGTSMITGVVEMPLFVNIRPRKTKHGGISVSMVNEQEGRDFLEQTLSFKEQMPLIKPKVTKKDLELMSENIDKIKTYLVPGALVSCKQNQKNFSILVELTQGKIIKDPEKEEYANIPDLRSLSPMQLQFLEAGRELGTFKIPEVMEKTGMNFTQTQDMISKMSKHGFMEFRNGKYRLSNDLATSLDEHAFFGKPVFEKIEHDSVLDKGVQLEEVKKKLAQFTDIIDMKDCYIVWYKPVHRKDGNIPKEQEAD